MDFCEFKVVQVYIESFRSEELHSEILSPELKRKKKKKNQSVSKCRLGGYFYEKVRFPHPRSDKLRRRETREHDAEE